jgi:CHAT domain-containing protein/tetratricopeptide (TPR) repeat protein
VLAIERDVLGGLSEDVAKTLGMLALLHEFRQDWRSARKAHQDILALRERQPDRKDWRAGDARRALAELERLSAMTPEERQRLRMARQLNKEFVWLMARGQYRVAEAAMRDAIQVFKDLLGEDHPDYATSLNNLGALYHAIGDYVRAEPLLRQAMEIMKKAVGEDHPRYATNLNNLATLYLDMGDRRRAEPLLRRALDTWRNAVGEDHTDYATSLNNLAALYQTDSDYAQAERLHRSVLEIRKKAVGEDHPDYATSLNNLAELYRHTGDNARAEPLHQKALEIRKKALGEDHPDYANSLNNVGMLYQAMGDYRRAEPLHQKALEIRKKAVGEDHPLYAHSLMNLAALYHAMGDYVKAEQLARRALEITKKVLGEDHPLYATSLMNLAAQYWAMGDHGRAEPLDRRALEITKKAVGEDHPLYADGLKNLAALYHHMGDYARAESMLTKALEIRSTLFDRIGSALADRPLFELLRALRVDLDGYLSVAQENRAHPESLYHRVLDWKGLSRARQADGLRARDRPELRPVQEELASVRARLAHLAYATPAQAQRAAWRKQIDALRARKEDLEAELARKSTTYRAGKRSTRVGPEEVAAALPAGTALVDLFVYNHYSPPPGGKGPLKKEPRLLAFVVRRDRPVICVALGDEKPVTDAAVAWGQALLAHRSEALHQSAAALGWLVWEPLRPHLADARTVLVAPDGTLVFFSFAALPGRKPDSYLIEDVAIGYVGSGREAAALLAAPEGTASAGLLAAGAIDFQADPGRAAPLPPGHPSLVVAAWERSGFAPLPGTRAEGELARDLFCRAFPDQPAVLLTGGEPTEAEVKKRLDGGHWRVVHLGTHGFHESPARVAALRAAVRREQPSAFASKAGKPDEDSAAFDLAPFLRSGIVLAGGGRTPDSSELDPLSGARLSEDGILTAEEVQSLDLRGTELVVLSACETGLGQGRYGQGVLGLQRAFHAAGARAVVASLWKVDDAATSVLMEQFYTNLWVKKMPRLETLRSAQLTVLNDPGLIRARRDKLAKERGISETSEKLPAGGIPAPSAAGARSDPSLWAAFVMSGDGR